MKYMLLLLMTMLQLTIPSAENTFEHNINKIDKSDIIIPNSSNEIIQEKDLENRWNSVQEYFTINNKPILSIMDFMDGLISINISDKVSFMVESNNVECNFYVDMDRNPIMKFKMVNLRKDRMIYDLYKRGNFLLLRKERRMIAILDIINRTTYVSNREGNRFVNNVLISIEKTFVESKINAQQGDAPEPANKAIIALPISKPPAR